MKLSRWWFYLVVGLVALAGVIFGAQPTDVLTFSSADARETALPLESLAMPDTAAEPSTAQGQVQKQGQTQMQGQAQGFDYFPDHYVNQAKAPAAPIDTF